MKQFTTPEQTAKLIELGFEKPRALVDKYYDYDAEAYAEVKAYSIGELIEIASAASIEIDNYDGSWLISSIYYNVVRPELIDCLFLLCVQLKEEGVI